MRRFFIAIGIVLAAGAPAIAEQGARAASKVTRVQKGTSAAIRADKKQPAQSLIQGTAVDGQERPLANATVHLRNLQLNKVEQVAIANQRGEFSFIAVPEVPYVVEVVNKAGQIVAVSDVIAARSGEVAAAVVTIPKAAQAVGGVLGQAVGSLTSVASTALSLVEPPAAEKPPVSPER
jgi:hypothetical protein